MLLRGCVVLAFPGQDAEIEMGPRVGRVQRQDALELVLGLRIRPGLVQRLRQGQPRGVVAVVVERATVDVDVAVVERVTVGDGTGLVCRC